MTSAIPRGRDELTQIYRDIALLHQAVSDAQALTVAEMRVTTPVAEIARMLEVTDKRIYQLLREAAAVEADPQRMRRAQAVAELIPSRKG